MTTHRTDINSSNTSHFSKFNILIAAGLLFTLIGLMIDVQTRQPDTDEIQAFAGCDGPMQTNILLSEEQLAKLLTIPERASKANVRELLAEPFCILPHIEIRSGVSAEREVYPLAFAPKTWLVLLFEGDEYAGYRISAQS